MELAVARQIIDTLAQGIHPVTGEIMLEDSPYNAPPVIRALFAVSQALQSESTILKDDDVDVACALARADEFRVTLQLAHENASPVASIILRECIGECASIVNRLKMLNAAMKEASDVA
jgi:hypothetical protein